MRIENFTILRFLSFCYPVVPPYLIGCVSLTVSYFSNLVVLSIIKFYHFILFGKFICINDLTPQTRFFYPFLI